MSRTVGGLEESMYFGNSVLSWFPALPKNCNTDRSSLSPSAQGKDFPGMMMELDEDEGGAGEEIEGIRPALKRPKADNRGDRIMDMKLLFNKVFPQGGGPGKDLIEDIIPEIFEADVISTLKFNTNGELLAVGDKGGRINLYKRVYDKVYRNVNYNHYFGFQSHEAEFDYLKSIEIEEKITRIEWIPKGAPANFLLATNDKTIKLWRVAERTSSSIEHLKDRRSSAITTLTFPRVVKGPDMIEAAMRKSFTNAHSYHINSISANSDQETFLSSDDLRVNLWNLEVTDQSFIIVDIKPDNMEFLNEVITTTSFHPTRCNIFAYGSSLGITKLCDMRDSALCDQHSKLFHDPSIKQDPSMFRNYFSEVISSISSIKFSHSGRYLATRDYLNLTIWDTLMENKPLATIPIHDYLQPHLSNLYENDAIFDQFGVSWNGSDSRLATGSYNNFFVVADTISSKSVVFETPKDTSNQSKTVPLKPKRVTNIQSNNSIIGEGGKVRKDPDEVQISDVDINKKVLYSEWHPKENILAVASCNNLYFFQDRKLFS